MGFMKKEERKQRPFMKGEEGDMGNEIKGGGMNVD
jgi:hypothetical protein